MSLRHLIIAGSFLIVASTILSCTKNCIHPHQTDGDAVAIAADTIVFAAIGDYGKAGSAEKKVSKLVKSWNPDFIITLGDNNYPKGARKTLDENIGQYYGDYIYNPCLLYTSDAADGVIG